MHWLLLADSLISESQRTSQVTEQGRCVGVTQSGVSGASQRKASLSSDYVNEEKGVDKDI